VGPPAELRARIEQEAGRDVRERAAWPWAVAAAALLLLTAGLRVEVSRLESRVDVPPDPALAIVDDLTERLGGDAAARRMATLMMLEQQMRAERAAADLEGQGRP
jgi:hypothetical protein